MKTFVVLVLLVAAVAFSSCEDDGQYRPELYGDDGQYRPTNEGRYSARFYPHYYNYFGRNARFNPVYAYNPYYYSFTPYQPIIAPIVSYGDQSGIDHESLASSLKAVTVKPPLTPVVTSTLPALRAASTTPAPVFNYRVPVYARNFYHTAEGNANILRQTNDINGNGYHYLYQTDNGISAEESGKVGSALVGGGTRATGFYEYVGDDGLKYRVDYTADENGFRPVGTHLP